MSRRNAGFIARTPLCFGFLSGTITRDTKFPPGDHRLGWSSAQLANWIDGARDLLDAVSASPGPAGVQAALRFCLAFAEVSTTIPGILTPAEAGQNAAASGIGGASEGRRRRRPRDQSQSAILRGGGTSFVTKSNRLPPWEEVAANAGRGGGLEIRRAVADQKRS